MLVEADDQTFSDTSMLIKLKINSIIKQYRFFSVDLKDENTFCVSKTSHGLKIANSLIPWLFQVLHVHIKTLIGANDWNKAQLFFFNSWISNHFKGVWLFSGIKTKLKVNTGCCLRCLILNNVNWIFLEVKVIVGSLIVCVISPRSPSYRRGRLCTTWGFEAWLATRSWTGFHPKTVYKSSDVQPPLNCASCPEFLLLSFICFLVRLLFTQEKTCHTCQTGNSLNSNRKLSATSVAARLWLCWTNYKTTSIIISTAEVE